MNAQALFQLAKIHATRKDYAEAEFFFERAKTTGKEQVRFQTLVEYAVMLVAQGKLDVAARQLREALGLKDDPRIREYLESVERYRSNI
jgi:tetratricopeptide (TPR) repeat protein